MFRTALVWLSIFALALGGIAPPAIATDVRAEQPARMGSGDDLQAIPMTSRVGAAAQQWRPAGTRSRDLDVLGVCAHPSRAHRTVFDAPAGRPVPILLSDPQSPGTGAVLG